MRIGWIDYLNTLPFNFEILGLRADFLYQKIRGVPSTINDLLSEEKIDVGFISSAHYLENYEEFLIFPDLSISAVNKVKSVIILSDIPINDISHIYLTGESKTSRYLTRIIFEWFLQKKVNYIDLENKDIKKVQSVLLIGDKAIKYSHSKPYTYDLSQIWHEKTGLPFVFALWCVRKDFYEKYPKEISKLWKLLKKSKDIFFSRPEKLLNTLSKADIQYLKNLDYNLTEKHLKSLELFSSYLLKSDILKEKAQFNFVGIK